jgi:hypothetical protein
MSGLLAMAQTVPGSAGDDSWNYTMDPVVFAATVSFGFNHPFMNGNGRIHRYLIHDVLERTEFISPGIVLPVSAVILANLREYVESLEAFPKPMLERTQFDPAAAERPAVGNDALYLRFFDCTVQAEFLYKALKRTIEDDL